MLYVLNFGHKLKPEIIAALTPATEVRVSLQMELDPGAEPTPRQIRRVIAQAAEEVKRKGGALDGTCPVALVLPGLAEGTALLLAAVHGLMGHFPMILALRRGGTQGEYELADEGRYPGMWGGKVDLERVRQAAREWR